MTCERCPKPAAGNCCSSHNKALCHRCYRETHFVMKCVAGCKQCAAEGLPVLLRDEATGDIAKQPAPDYGQGLVEGWWGALRTAGPTQRAYRMGINDASAAAAARIRAELVCCDIYDQDASTGRTGGLHAICFWGEAAARLAEEVGETGAGLRLNESPHSIAQRMREQGP